ncbi:MAG: hypothetical protein HOH43_14870 [Candidatus Latescibacteria bacterium]|nr:hypothetical protein [Candidatus Latescibacterota bacterium]
MDESYAIQSRVTELMGLPLAGWKIGAASKTVAKAEGADTAVSGRLFTPNIHHTPASLGIDMFTSFRNCEVEFVLRTGRVIPASTSAHSRESIRDAVDMLFPAIEIGDSRLSDRATAGFLAVCADNAGGTHLVLGEGIKEWRQCDLALQEVSLQLNGDLVARGSGADVMGNPLNALEWLVKQQSELGRDIPSGSLIATGSCTGINMAAVHDWAVADFGELGSVEIRF